MPAISPGGAEAARTNRSDARAIARAGSASARACSVVASPLTDRVNSTVPSCRSAAGGARVVLPGTIYNYDPRAVSVIDAGTPQRPQSRKGTIRVAMERMLEEAAPDVPALILRAGDFFGPGSRQSWFSQALVTPGKPVRRIVNPAVVAGHSWAYLPDLAETFARLMDAGNRLNAFERLQFAGHVDESGTGMIDAVRAGIARRAPVWTFPWWLMRLLAPFGGFPREVIEVEPFWRHPVRLDNRRLVALVGEEPRAPRDEAVARTLAALGCLDRSLNPHTLQTA